MHPKPAPGIQKSSWVLPASPRSSRKAVTKLRGLQFPQHPRSSIGVQMSPCCLSPPPLPGLAVLAPHLGGHSRIAPKGHGSCRFGRLKLALNLRPGFVHRSCENPHLLKSLFPIQGGWTAQWKKMQLLCCRIQNAICV